MSKPKPTLIEVLKDIEALLKQNGFDDFENAHQYAFIDRLLLLKETIASAFSVDRLLRRSPPPVPALPPPSAGVGAAAVPPSAVGGAPLRAPAPQFQLTDQQNMDIKYSVLRSRDFPPLSFAPGIDAYSAMVGVLVSCGQGDKFANSVAFRTCFQVWFLFF
jgi:hypothetical protein